MEFIPLALGATGAVGNEVKESGKDLKHAYKTTVLPIKNASAVAAFNDAWTYRISTPSNDARPEFYMMSAKDAHTRLAAPMSTARIAKDQQVAEAALRGKDPEWHQTQDIGHTSTARTTRRAGSGGGVPCTTRRVRTRG